ncbi:hypothetical protein FA10DRAFT_264093 [Acaromyces ingoldii]|uniref:25S rRNA adenine-N(1) methyltransferase n=1 Tax=Acaromyces ingoldii TaxID=215250 RepID=A0A316YWD6_9BASI|nr:hypothetical protein FA10DRAFT_264093 [Acaromyces ingoldii]PWN93442.1 hypothetical protein FA10DRAFT_264093 [Acaromyces ingoldii]
MEEETTLAPVAQTEAGKDGSKGKKREPLRRPRGKRGGVKHQRKEKSSTSSSKGPAAVVKGKVKGQGKSEGKGRGKNDKPPSDHAAKIAKFHALEKKIAQTDDAEEKARLREEQGGLDAYQDASLFGGDRQRGGESGKWCAEKLELLRGKGRPVRLLDVGALSGTSYQKYTSWIQATSIDINPRGDHVEKYAFLDYPKPASDEDRFDVVAQSLVVNFVGDLKERGRMLIHAHDYLKPDGYLYLVLPLACVTNSRYLDHERLRSILDSCGWNVVVQDDSKRLTRWLCQRKGALSSEESGSIGETNKGKKAKKGKRNNDQAEWDGTEWKKQEIKVGATLNNFCIVVRRDAQ